MVILSMTMPRFAEPDYLLFSREGSLFAQHLVSEAVPAGWNSHNPRGECADVRPAFSASAHGVLAYRQTNALQSTGVVQPGGQTARRCR